MGTLDQIERVTLAGADAARLGLPGAPLVLDKAVPSGPDHLALQYGDAAGGRAAAQWMRDRERLEAVARETSRPPGAALIVDAGAERILVQVRGADRRLEALAGLVAAEGATLLAHRPEGRGVVRMSTQSGIVFAKVVRPSRLAELVDRHRRAGAAGCESLRVPAIVNVVEDGGVLVLSEVPGRSAFDRLAAPDTDSTAEAAGAALRRFHDHTPGAGLPAHVGEHEAAVVRIWAGRVTSFCPGVAGRVVALLPAATARLGEAESSLVTAHRDFYDKQVLVDDEGRVGLIDFDLIARGEPALDLANFLVHLDLRVLQGRLEFGAGRRAAERFLIGYSPGPEVRGRLAPYMQGTRLRLACVYAMRPRWRRAAEAMLGAAEAWRP